ncbi:MAG: cytochrome b [Betaproteobacteria bacterium]
MTSPRPASPGADAGRHDPVAAALHWLIGLALLAQIVFGFLLDDIAPRGTPSRAAVINLHKSFGIVLGVAIVLRLGWRLAHPPPAWPGSMPAWQRRAAAWGHGALYACMVVMPLSGYVGSNFSKYGVKFFGVALAPWGPELPGVYEALAGVHAVTGWIFAALIAGHVLAALQHAFVAHDGIFARIWPWRTSPGISR